MALDTFLRNPRLVIATDGGKLLCEACAFSEHELGIAIGATFLIAKMRYLRDQAQNRSVELQVNPNHQS